MYQPLFAVQISMARSASWEEFMRRFSGITTKEQICKTFTETFHQLHDAIAAFFDERASGFFFFFFSFVQCSRTEI